MMSLVQTTLFCKLTSISGILALTLVACALEFQIRTGRSGIPGLSESRKPAR